MGEKRFFGLLRRKIHREPGHRADAGFWRRFEEEFDARIPTTLPWWRWAVPVAVTTVLLVVLGPRMLYRDGAELANTSPIISPLVEQSDLLDHLDLFLDLPEDAAGDLANLDEKEWEILLEERSG